MSPASTPSLPHVQEAAETLATLGLHVQLGDHVFDQHGYLAGIDEHRLADLNNALRDPGVAAVIATCGGKGAYRLAADLDVDAVRRQPKLLIGFSDIVVLQVALLRACGLTSLHGAPWNADFSARSAASFVTAAFTAEAVTVRTDPTEPTAALTTTGRASGRLIGGNQDSVAISSGWAMPDLNGAILLLEAYNLRLGHIDRQLTMLKRSGTLDGIVGIAIGQYTECGADASTQGEWTEIDVLRDQLWPLGIPILGGLPIGHGDSPVAVPIGTTAIIDADNGTLQVDPAVQ